MCTQKYNVEQHRYVIIACMFAYRLVNAVCLWFDIHLCGEATVNQEIFYC